MPVKRRPPIGTRVMWVYGRKDYASYGEVGTITAHDADSRHTFTVTTDDYQPFHRVAFGSKSKPTGHSRELTRVTVRECPRLAEVYRETARRLRDVARYWDEAARGVMTAATSEQDTTNGEPT
ncbi:hypothetical protein [Microbacterium sp. 22296]|uniref:hypothetical protein n=1 Tax=Microbacterium sp. 22296 TaxID=3453903 RepID=UPI003F86CD5A